MGAPHDSRILLPHRCSVSAFSGVLAISTPAQEAGLGSLPSTAPGERSVEALGSPSAKVKDTTRPLLCRLPYRLVHVRVSSLGLLIQRVPRAFSPSSSLMPRQPTDVTRGRELCTTNLVSRKEGESGRRTPCCSTRVESFHSGSARLFRRWLSLPGLTVFVPGKRASHFASPAAFIL